MVSITQDVAHDAYFFLSLLDRLACLGFPSPVWSGQAADRGAVLPIPFREEIVHPLDRSPFPPLIFNQASSFKPLSKRGKICSIAWGLKLALAKMDFAGSTSSSKIGRMAYALGHA